MSMEKFEEKWFSIHNQLGDLIASGLEFRRVVALLVTYDPHNISVNELI